jgi:hypothetical protein
MINCPVCGAELVVVLEEASELENVHKVVAPEPYVQYRAPNGLPDETVFDATGQIFYQSATSNPDDYGPETYTGADATPRQIYPIRLGSVFNPVWRGGVVHGRHPIDVDVGVYETQNAPEDQPYVNSAAILMDSGLTNKPSTTQIVERVRLVNVWDGIRFASYEGNHISTPGKYNNIVNQCWLDGILDDAFENDHDQGCEIIESLIENFFELISARKNDGIDRSTTDTIVITDCLLKIAPRVYNKPNYKWSGTYFNCPYKHTATSPNIKMQNTILAIEGIPNPEPGKIGQWSSMWNKFSDLGGNKILYLSGDIMPSSDMIGVIPSGFEQLTGEAAQTMWNMVREAWISEYEDDL